MEELLPLIIGIIWLLYSFYNRGKKKKSREQRPETEKTVKEEPSFIEQLFASDEIQFEESKPRIYDEYGDEMIGTDIAEEEVAQKEVVNPFLERELSEFHGEGYIDKEKQKKNRIEELLKDEDEEFQFDEDLFEEFADFDLKKAVIYSEILNPPYIDYK